MERITKPISRFALLVFMMLSVNPSGLAQTEPTAVPNMRTMLLRDERAVAQLDLSARQRQFLRQALDRVDTPLWRLRDQDATQRHTQVSTLLQQFDDAHSCCAACCESSRRCQLHLHRWHMVCMNVD